MKRLMYLGQMMVEYHQMLMQMWRMQMNMMICRKMNKMTVQIECPGNASDEDCMEDGGQEENDEQDIENYEDFVTDLLESSGSIYDQPEDAHREEDSDPTTMLSREENDPECSTTAQHKENTPHPWAGYKIVGDNVDKNIHPSFQRTDWQIESLHYFHVCAAEDRVDFSLLQIPHQPKW